MLQSTKKRIEISTDYEIILYVHHVIATFNLHFLKKRKKKKELYSRNKAKFLLSNYNRLHK